MQLIAELRRRVEPRHAAAIAVVCLVLGLGPFFLNPYALSLLTLALGYGLFAFGLDLAWGRADVVSIGQASFFGIGAYGVAIAQKFGLSWVVGGLVALVIAGALSLIIGVIGLRRRALASTMAVLTLALTLLISQLAQAATPITNGSNGLYVQGLPLVSGYYLTAIVVVALVCIVWIVVLRGRLGRRAFAVKSNAQRAEHLGIHPSAVRLKMFVLGAVISAVAGIIAAPQIGLISPSAAGIMLSTQVLVWLAVGGLGTILGAFIGAALISIGEQYLGAAVGQWYLLILGVIFVLIVRFAPKGLAGVVQKIPLPKALARFFSGDQFPSAHATGTHPLAERSADTSALSLSEVAVSFGEMAVIKRVDLDVQQGEIVCLIGPNGAGKTTLLNLIAGDLAATNGSIEMFGDDITHWAAHKRTLAGLGRMFQIPSLFLDLSPADNIRLARAEAKRHVQLPEQYQYFETETDTKVAELSLAARRALEIAVVLAEGPEIVLLDEPAAGLSHDDSMELASTLRSVAKHTGSTMIVVEHDMAIVRELADRVVVLVNGTLMFEGTLDEVSSHPEVREAYLGAQNV